MLQKIGYDYDPSEWRTIPHNENEKPAIFVDHATGLQKKIFINTTIAKLYWLQIA